MSENLTEFYSCKASGDHLFDSQQSLDPNDWDSLRALGHRMLDDVFENLETIRDRPVWQKAPDAIERQFQTGMPCDSGDLQTAYELFRTAIMPFAVGNAHPGFMGWAHGGGTAVGVLAELLAAGLNANLGGRDHIPIAVEQQIVRWMAEAFEFPEGASGLFVTGSSMANFIGVLIARHAKLGPTIRSEGIVAMPKSLVGYTSSDAHGCVAQAFELAGLGSKQLRKIPVDDRHQMDVAQLEKTIASDRDAGGTPFCVIATSGTVDVGAIDPMLEIRNIATREQMWMHVDGACGGLGKLSPSIARKLVGIELADSIAMDFHKWGQVPYDAGFILVRDAELHEATFASHAAYLRREARGMSAGSPWPCDFGPDLSRSFKALKVWFTLQVYGARRLGQMMDRSCELAAYLANKVEQNVALELLAPVELNIVCFGYCCADSNRVNAEIVVAIQESGLAAPSATTIRGQVAIRAAIFNHRTGYEDIDRLVDAAVRFGQTIASNTILQNASSTSQDVHAV